jgi:hypothetical protein
MPVEVGTKLRWVVNFTSRPLYLRGKSPFTNRTGGWVGPRAGLDVTEKRKISFPCRESNPGRPACSLVAIPTELSRLLTYTYDPRVMIDSCTHVTAFSCRDMLQTSYFSVCPWQPDLELNGL